MIEEYPDDTPYPSRLILGSYKGRMIHVAAELLKDAEERANTGAQVEIRQYVDA